MANRIYPATKSFNLFDQKIALQSSYPTSNCKIKGKVLWWFGKIRPTPLSKEYLVIMTYELYCAPQVWVVGEELEQLESPTFPHKYHIDVDKKMVRICLYRYLSEFSSKKLLARTIIPWTIEWLYFYELWLATGEWLGGGEHPNNDESKTDLRENTP